MGPPGLDIVVALGAVIAAPIFGVKSSLTSNEDRKQSYATTAGVLTLTGIVFLTSAVIGAVRVRDCQRATTSWENYRQPQQPMYPGYPGYGSQPGYGPPPQPYPAPQPYPQPPPPPPQPPTQPTQPPT